MKIILPMLLITTSLLISCNNQDTNQKNTTNEKSSVETKQPKQSTDTNNTKRHVVFKINGKPYFKKDIKNMNIQTAINDAIIYEAAKIEQKHQDPEYITLIERYKRNILVGRHKGDIIKDYISTKNVTKEDMQKYYEENISRFTSLDLIKISTMDKSISDQIYNQLLSDTHPDEIKSQYENLIVYKMDDNRKYNDKFKTLKKSEIIGPLLENKFYNIYIIDDIHTKKFERVKRSLKMQMINQYKQDALKEYIEKAKTEKNIQVDIVNN